MKNRIERIISIPSEDNDFDTQLFSILKQLKEYSRHRGWFTLHASFFIDAESNEEYLKHYNSIQEGVYSILNFKPSLSIIAQTPANGDLISLEIVFLVVEDKMTQVFYKEHRGIAYTLVISNGIREIYAGGISSKNYSDDFYLQVDNSYRLMKSILTTEGFTFADVVRQWNYVEDILSIGDDARDQNQHYQILNDVRSKYYSESEFRNGYPAATGIGANAGGLILEFYAIHASPAVEVIPVRNPKQTDAYYYSDNVLKGAGPEKHNKNTTPKFERAKYSNVNGVGSIFISGTASIQSEETLGKGNTRMQAEITLENISNLTSRKNLLKTGIRATLERFKYTFIRVYIKHKRDLSVVRNICESHFGNIPVHYLLADICRDDLLLEIEGVAELI